MFDPAILQNLSEIVPSFAPYGSVIMVDSLAVESNTTRLVNPIPMMFKLKVPALPKSINSNSVSDMYADSFLLDNQLQSIVDQTSLTTSDSYFLNEYASYKKGAAKSEKSLNSFASSRVDSWVTASNNYQNSIRSKEPNNKLEALRNDQNILIENYKKISGITPLVMLINPSSFDIGMSKLIIDGTFTREGYINEHWGEQLDTITCSGKIGAYHTYFKYNNETILGVNRSFKLGSLTYQNLIALLMIYKHNGCVRTDLINPQRISTVGSVLMYYDGYTYEGNFNSFSFKESADNPFNMEYDFEFAVSLTHDEWTR
jgi:hypothetical protein